MDRNIIRNAKSVYEVAYIGKMEYKSEEKASLIYGVEVVLLYAEEEKKRELLGENAYLDYLNYKKKMNEKGIIAFPKTLDFMLSKKINIGKESEIKTLQELIDKKEICKETIIAANLVKEHFSIEEFKSLISKFDLERKQFQN